MGISNSVVSYDMWTTNPRMDNIPDDLLYYKSIQDA